MSRRLSFSSSSPWFEKISSRHPCYLPRSSYQSLRYPKYATIGYLEVSIQNNQKNRSNYNVSYAQTCYRTKIKLTLALTNRKCLRNWFKTTQNGEQNNPEGGVWKLSLRKLLVKFVRFGLKGTMNFSNLRNFLPSQLFARLSFCFHEHFLNARTTFWFHPLIAIPPLQFPLICRHQVSHDGD